MRVWKRVRRGMYEYRDGSEVLATIEGDYPPTCGHFALWSVVGVLGHHPTLRDAKAFAEHYVRTEYSAHGGK